MFLTEEQAKNKDLICYLLKQIITAPIEKIKPLRTGKTSHTYEVNNDLIVKFPSYKTILSDWQMQSENALVLQRMLSFQIPQVNLKQVFLNSTSKQSLTVLSYPKIQGHIVPRDDFVNKPAQFKQRFFEQLSDATMQIHDVLPNSLPVPPLTTEELARRMFPVRPDNRVFNKIFHSMLYMPVVGFKEVSKRILCHSDLHSNNICLDEKDNLVGILDFDSLNQGDYFCEFRPALYKSEADNEQFKQMYEKMSGRTISNKDIQRMAIVYNLMRNAFYTSARIKKIVGIKPKMLPLPYTNSRDFS